MSEIFLITAPRDKTPKKAIYTLLEALDCKKWIIGKERGKNGYEHWQIRVETSSGEFFERWSKVLPHSHIEKSTHNWSDSYERKEGCFWTYCDTNDVRIERFGDLRPWQKQALKALRTQNDRQVDVWYDHQGNHGKSWLCGHLHETGKACVVPRDWTNASEIVNFLVHNYNNEGIVVIDIPRSTTIPKGFYETIEMVKDGLLGTTKWEGKMRNIRGVKVLIFTNHFLDRTKLSVDRWRFYEVTTVQKWHDSKPYTTVITPEMRKKNREIIEQASKQAMEILERGGLAPPLNPPVIGAE